MYYECADCTSGYACRICGVETAEKHYIRQGHGGVTCESCTIAALIADESEEEGAA